MTVSFAALTSEGVGEVRSSCCDFTQCRRFHRNVPSRACPAVIVRKASGRDAIIDENGETAAQPDCGVGAAECLVGISSGKVSAMLTEIAAPGIAWSQSALNEERHRCKILIACMSQILRLVCRVATSSSLAKAEFVCHIFG
jgi:hypothetical protein